MQGLLQAIQIHVSLERMIPLRVVSGLDHQFQGGGTLGHDVRVRRVKGLVRRHHVARLQQDLEQYPFCGSALVDRGEVGEPKELPLNLGQAVIAAGPRVRLIAPVQRGPLLVAHRPRTAVREQIDGHGLRGKVEQVEAGLPDVPLSFFPGRQGDTFHGLYLERLEHVRVHRAPPLCGLGTPLLCSRIHQTSRLRYNAAGK